MVALCRRVVRDEPEAVRCLVAWSVVRMNRWVNAHRGIVPERLDNFLGPVWMHTLQNSAQEVAARKTIDNRRALALMIETLHAAAKEAQHDLKDHMIDQLADTVAGVMMGTAPVGMPLDVVRFRAHVFIHVLLKYGSAREREVVLTTSRYLRSSLAAVIETGKAPEMTVWDLVARDLEARGVRITETNCRQRWFQFWQKVLGDLPYLRFLHERLIDARSYEDPEEWYERWMSYPAGLVEWKKGRGLP
jgi:hypothetical protein